jgi:hypothetical protein
MYYCKHCNHQIFPIRNLGKIPTLKGKEIHINPKMYCSKECFVTKNIFTRRYEVFDYEEPKSYERRIHFSLDNCVKYNKNEKNELNNNKA